MANKNKLKALLDELKETDKRIKETTSHAELDDLLKRRWAIYDDIEELGYGVIPDVADKPISLTFTTRTRWGSGRKQTLLMRVPKDLVIATDIKQGDYLSVAILKNHGKNIKNDNVE